MNSALSRSPAGLTGGVDRQAGAGAGAPLREGRGSEGRGFGVGLERERARAREAGFTYQERVRPVTPPTLRGAEVGAPRGAAASVAGGGFVDVDVDPSDLGARDKGPGARPPRGPVGDARPTSSFSSSSFFCTCSWG